MMNPHIPASGYQGHASSDGDVPQQHVATLDVSGEIHVMGSFQILWLTNELPKCQIISSRRSSV